MYTVKVTGVEHLIPRRRSRALLRQPDGAWEPSPQLIIRASWFGYSTLEDALQAARRIMADNPDRRVVVVGRAGR